MKLIYEFFVLLFIFGMIGWFISHDPFIGLIAGVLISGAITGLFHSMHKKPAQTLHE